MLVTTQKCTERTSSNVEAYVMTNMLPIHSEERVDINTFNCPDQRQRFP